jgi:hypothetical protein
MPRKNGAVPAKSPALPRTVYVIELSEKQARVMQAALEEYFRIRLGQWSTLAESLAFSNKDLSSSNPKHEQIFNACCLTRDHLQNLFDAATYIAWPSRSIQKTEQQMIAEDIWRYVRHAEWLHKPESQRSTWDVAGAPLFPTSAEKPLKIVIVQTR